MKSWSPYVLLAIAAIALDQWVKHLVETGHIAGVMAAELRLDPARSEAHYGLGILREGRGNLAGATESLMNRTEPSSIPTFTPPG